LKPTATIQMKDGRGESARRGSREEAARLGFGPSGFNPDPLFSESVESVESVIALLLFSVASAASV
jgi:hypothetical protein